MGGGARAAPEDVLFQNGKVYCCVKLHSKRKWEINVWIWKLSTRPPLRGARAFKAAAHSVLSPANRLFLDQQRAASEGTGGGGGGEGGASGGGGRRLTMGGETFRVNEDLKVIEEAEEDEEGGGAEEASRKKKEKRGSATVSTGSVASSSSGRRQRAPSLFKRADSSASIQVGMRISF